MRFKSVYILVGLIGTACSDHQQQQKYAPSEVEPSAIIFEKTISTSNPFTPEALDINGDGWPEALGFENIQGNMRSKELAGDCLAAMFKKGRINRDVRLADFDNDGKLELISNTYSNTDMSDSKAVYCEQGDDPFTFTVNKEALGESFGGHGETIAIFDFDNDGDLDIFLPYYTMEPNAELAKNNLVAMQPNNIFLRNDGNNQYTDIAVEAGVGQPKMALRFRTEGVDIIDFNNDGWLDMYATSELLVGSKKGKFKNIASKVGLPKMFDEGARFADLNNDGYFDLVLNDPSSGAGVAIFYNKKGKKFKRDLTFDFTTGSEHTGYGLAVADVNFDGWLDIIAADNPKKCATHVYINGKDGFIQTEAFKEKLCGDLITKLDYNLDGKVDILYRVSRPTLFTNIYPGYAQAFAIIALDKKGRKNQQGRTITASPQKSPELVLTRTIDPGSGYMSRSPYPVLFNTPENGPHLVTVHFASGKSEFIVHPGQRVTIREGSKKPVYEKY